MKKVGKIILMVAGGVGLLLFGVYKFLWKPQQDGGSSK